MRPTPAPGTYAIDACVLQRLIHISMRRSSWVDVRDLAKAHVLALQKEEAAGERIIVRESNFKWQDWSTYPSLVTSCCSLMFFYAVNHAHKLDSTVPEGAAATYKPEEAVHWLVYDNSKERRIFGIDLIGKEESTRDMLAVFKEKGWWPVATKA